MPRRIEVYRIPMGAPDDLSGLAQLIDAGTIDPTNIVAVLAKTEGNGCVNDWTRGFTSLALKVFLAERLGESREAVGSRVAMIMSGGTEGVITPHMTVFSTREVAGPPQAGKRLTAAVAFTREFLPEELGTMAMVRGTAACVQKAMTSAGIDDARDVHFVQLKCPLLTAERIAAPIQRGQQVVTTDTYKSMAYSRGAAALGVALALGEVPAYQLAETDICTDWRLYSRVASASAGVELANVQVLLLGNTAATASDLVIGHDVMQDPIDAKAVQRALTSVGIPDGAGLERVVNVFAKAEAPSNGRCRGRRHTMLDDSDINHTRAARAAVGAVIASVIGDPMVYVSGGAEHQGPDGGGPVAVIARANPS